MHIKTLKIKNEAKNKTKIINFFVNNKLFTFLIFVFISGITLGNLFLESSEKRFFYRVTELLNCHIKLRSTSPFLGLFVESIFSNFVFVVIIFIMGLSAWGIVLVPPVVFFRGYLFGLFQNCVFSTYGKKGILFLVLVILPGFLISILAITLLAKEAIKISNIFSNMLLDSTNWQSDEKYVKSYLLKTGCILILSVFSAFLDAVFNFLFYRFFSF